MNTDVLFKILFIILAYFLGSVPWGFIIGKIHHIDIRTIGSKNIGATNTGRALGKKYAVLVYFLDAFKGAFFVALFRYGVLPSSWCVLSPILYGVVACIGHAFPVWLKFKGGKCVACGSGAVFAFCPPLAIIGLVTFYITLLSSKMVSLSSLTADLVLFITCLVLTFINDITFAPFFFSGFDFIALTCMFVISLIVFVKHSSNIKRIINGTESKIKSKNNT